MEVSLTAKHQSLTLTSCIPLSSSFLSSSNLRSIRRQFVGCGHNLRPLGGLRSRRKYKKVGLLHIQPPRFVFRASLDSHSILVVVAIVTFSAVSLLYFNHNKRKKSVKEIPTHPTFALPQLGSDTGNHIVESQILGFEDLQTESLLKEVELKDNSHETSQTFEDEEAQLPFWRSAVVNEEAIMSPASSVLASNVNHSSNISEVTDQVLSPMFFERGAVQPIEFSNELTDLQMEESQEEIKSDPELPISMDEIKYTTASVCLNNAFAELNEHGEPKVELGEEGQIISYDAFSGEEGQTISYDAFSGESVREELYMFYGVDKSSAAPLKGLRSSSPRASVSNRNKVFSPMRSAPLKGAESIARNLMRTVEHVEGNSITTSYKEGLSPHQKGKFLRKGIGFSRDTERSHLAQNGSKVFPQSPWSHETHVDQKSHSSELFRPYNHLLKYGRVSECVDLLKDMESKGFLDMNKVYHAKFFNICKRQKAVREAFDYVKLIPNPSLSTFTMLMSVCTRSQDSEGAFQVLDLVQEAGLKPDCKLYTTLISTCAKSGKVDQMFEVFHEMVNSGAEPNVHTYGALIDGCARAGQVAKAFGVYGIMRSKNVKPDRVVFNALISACGQSGAVDRAFDVLAEMAAETQPIDPDHITLGALIKACANDGQVDRAREVYKMIHQFNIKGTPEVYTIALNCCSQTGDWEFACSVYSDMTSKGVVPDEMFLSALIDVAGHAGKLDTAFEVLQEAQSRGVHVGILTYSSLMGACCNAKNWQKALELYEDLKSVKLMQTVSTVNALITALCDGNQLQKAMEVFSEMKVLGLRPNRITYSVLLVASEKKDDIEAGLMLLSQAKRDGVAPNLIMCRCIIGMCLRRFESDCSLGEPILSFDSGRPQVNNKWSSAALLVYRRTIGAGEMPTVEILSQVLGCLQLPYDASLKIRLIENLGVSAARSRCTNLCSLIDGFGEYDPRAFSLLEEAASRGILQSVSFKESPVIVDAKGLPVCTAEVYLLTVFKGLKHRFAAGTRMPNLIILLPIEKTKILSPRGEKTINLAGRVGQAVSALLRRLGIPYQGNESYGKIRIYGISLRKWFQPKLASPFSGKPSECGSSQSRLGKSIIHQQRNIRIGNLFLE
ncbi:Pentatricopeptide repeat [Quillaja saponaria]|uniref:Pentatricopeptide repeat n=1 Tax=Quillaja saponaria TaxID=32244 RepID=A0AAD7LZK3_QUISA|nr:Pentatricopeptide repeat [Quillaja saponaria]